MTTHFAHGRMTATVPMRALLLAGAGALALSSGHAFAEGSGGGAVAGDGSEGTNVDTLIVTADRNPGAAAAPVKAALTETQPESLISHKFIEQFTPETGNYTTVVLIAPSLSGITANGGGVGEYNKINMRGFSDGQYNITYDGIFYGDTNDPTHHPASFFPASTIGAAVVDRGPGAAGDLGQANKGGAIHFFSPAVSQTFAASQKLTYGTANTYDSVTTLQSGAIGALGGTRILLNLDIRRSDGELSNSGGVAINQLIKIVTPLGPHGLLTLFGSHNYTRFFQSDAGPGETLQQVALYGKDFALLNDPTSEFNKNFNTQKKQTDFEYADLRYDFGSGITAEDQGYTYFYSNKTISVDDTTGLIDGPNTSHPKQKTLNQADIGGYNKGNRYRVYGNIVRVNTDFGFGELKAGALVETSSTDRHNILYDLTTGAPDLRYPSVPPAPPQNNVSNIKTLELSSWNQYQLFADLELRPIDKLTITPGIKYVHLTPTVNAAIANRRTPNFARGPVSGSNTYEKPLYFATANYRVRPEWSVYFQYATGFLIPALSTLQVNNVSLNELKPEQSINYQAGAVYSKGPLTADGDVYLIDVTNLSVPDPTGQFYINAGAARYKGIEGQAAYLLPLGVTLFANGSLNSAVSRPSGKGLDNAPKWTAAFGALYDKGPWQGSLTFKQVGRFTNGAAVINPYSTVNATAAYSFGQFKVKFAVYNLANQRSITSSTSGATLSASDLYTFQAGREVQVTLQAKFP